MKILCEYSPCGPSFVRTGWARVFQAMNHDFRFWDPRFQSAFDAFGEINPDIFIGTTYGVDNAVYKCIAKRPKMKVALYASAWGPLVDKVDTKKYPITVVQPEEKLRLQKLKAETGQPKFVFIHVTNAYLEPTMSGWNSIGIMPVGILNAADVFDYSAGVFDASLACDVGFVGGYWPYKARNLNQYILPLCQPDSGLKVKIFGNQAGWPVCQYLGNIDTKDVKNLFVSATVCPNVSEPHSTDLGWDCIERPFKVLAAGGFCISDHVDEMGEIFTDHELIMADTPKQFGKLIKHFIKSPDDRLPFIKAGQAKVLAQHTYFDRVAVMMDNLGMKEEAAKALEAKKRFLGAE